MDYITSLKSFIKVVENGSFSKAARVLDISSSQLTKQIQWLENIMSTRLFERTTKLNYTTETGKILYIYAVKILEEIKLAQESIDNFNIEPSGKLVLVSPTSINRKWINQITTNFLIKYPKIQLTLYGKNSPHSIFDGEADIAISNINLSHENIIKIPFFSLYRSLFVSPKYIKKYGLPKTTDELIDHACLVNIKDSPALNWEFRDNKRVQINPRYITDSTDNLVKPAIYGLGIIWVSKDLVQDEINNGDLVEVKLDVNSPPLNFYIYYRPVSKSSNIRLLSDFLLKDIQNMDLSFNI